MNISARLTVCPLTCLPWPTARVNAMECGLPFKARVCSSLQKLIQHSNTTQKRITAKFNAPVGDQGVYTPKMNTTSSTGERRLPSNYSTNSAPTFLSNSSTSALLSGFVKWSAMISFPLTVLSFTRRATSAPRGGACPGLCGCQWRHCCRSTA